MMVGMRDEVQGLGRESRRGWTPLHLAADEQDAAAVGSLLAAGAWVDAPDEQGNTPLRQAVFTYRGDGAVLSVPVSAGADHVQAPPSRFRPACRGTELPHPRDGELLRPG
ncbi:ankyrin repeat domain-containing protein [Streptomyces sp. NPDC050564]|uniref:ankyrin repeat domain-containing protein n=1 Tax=Streptomyces sp. NPDC050564 TaxID=3365631 RepID=UPI0037BE1E07